MTKTRVISIFIRLAFSAALLAYVLSKTNLSLLINSFQHIKVLPIVAVMLLFIPSQLLNSYRWHYILCSLNKPIPFHSVLRFNTIGAISNLFIPGTVGGEVSRMFMASRKINNVPLTITSLLIDKLSILTAIGLFLILSSQIIDKFFSSSFTLFIGTFITVLTFSVILILGNTRIAISLHIPAPFIAKVRIPTQKIFFTILLGFGLQAANVVGTILLAVAFNIHIPWLAWLGIHAIFTLLNALPISINGLGIRENTFAVLLSFFGVSQSTSVAFSLTSFVIQSVLIVIFWAAVELLNTKSQAQIHALSNP